MVELPRNVSSRCGGRLRNRCDGMSKHPPFNPWNYLTPTNGVRVEVEFDDGSTTHATAVHGNVKTGEKAHWRTDDGARHSTATFKRWRPILK